MENLIGRELGQYRILEEIGRGGMAVVYKAYQPTLERYIAIKVLPQQFTFDREFVERFLREARAAARLNHPHIVTIHDVGQADSTYYIVMEYLEGPSLADLLRQHGALPPQQAAQIVAQVASALDYAHRQGFVHRDVKPSNVLLSAGGMAKLTDFGIVKAAEGTRLTQTGTLLGTPEYMSPEQAKGLGIDYRSDIYSLGVVAYEMLTGRVPFEGDTPHMLHAHVYEEPRPLPQMNPKVSPAVGTVVNKALDKEPGKRYGSAGTFAAALGQAARSREPGVVREPAPPRPPPPPVMRAGQALLWPLFGGLCAVLMVAVMVLGIRESINRPDQAAATETAVAQAVATQMAAVVTTETAVAATQTEVAQAATRAAAAQLAAQTQTVVAVAQTQTVVAAAQTPAPTICPTANIVFPQNGATVGESVIVRGVIPGLGSGQRAFLCVKSQAFGRLTYPQGEIFPDPIGQWAVESIYRSIGYSYETFVVITSNPDAAEMLADTHYRAYGMRRLPQDTVIISPVIVVTRG